MKFNTASIRNSIAARLTVNEEAEVATPVQTTTDDAVTTEVSTNNKESNTMKHFNSIGNITVRGLKATGKAVANTSMKDIVDNTVKAAKAIDSKVEQVQLRLDEKQAVAEINAEFDLPTAQYTQPLTTELPKFQLPNLQFRNNNDVMQPNCTTDHKEKFNVNLIPQSITAKVTEHQKAKEFKALSSKVVEAMSNPFDVTVVTPNKETEVTIDIKAKVEAARAKIETANNNHKLAKAVKLAEKADRLAEEVAASNK